MLLGEMCFQADVNSRKWSRGILFAKKWSEGKWPYGVTEIGRKNGDFSLKKECFLFFQCNSRVFEHEPIDKIFCSIFEKTSKPFSKNQKLEKCKFSVLCITANTLNIDYICIARRSNTQSRITGSW
jgi:hypothetical protein